MNLEINGETRTLEGWQSHPDCKVHRSSIRRRLKQGMSPYEAVFNPPLGSVKSGRKAARSGKNVGWRI